MPKLHIPKVTINVLHDLSLLSDSPRALLPAARYNLYTGQDGQLDSYIISEAISLSCPNTISLIEMVGDFLGMEISNMGILDSIYKGIYIRIHIETTSNLLSFRFLYSYSGVCIFYVEGKTSYNIGRRLTEGVWSLGIRRDIFFKQIGAKIAYYRTLYGMGQVELAKRAHISQSALSRIEHGKYNENVSISMILDIAEGLEIDPSLLTTFSDMEKKMWGFRSPEDM